MKQGTSIYAGGLIFDGQVIHEQMAARFVDGQFSELVPVETLNAAEPIHNLHGAILCPGYVDLQVNGGGGIMFNDDPSVSTLVRIANAHLDLGTRWILPTLITDTPTKTDAAISAAIAAVEAGVTEIAGLHLEGPHLSVARKGAHDAALIRPMEATDLAKILDAARTLPALMVTIAPENVSRNQVEAMAAAGIIVSLGHSDADFETCLSYVEAGASCVTHLFNAMSQLGNREPGLVGAALHSGKLSAGLIADGIHVHPTNINAAWRAKAQPGEIFLVSDAMAVAGTENNSFELEGRCIKRAQNRLTLSDGTLAGADLDLTTAMQTLARATDIKMHAVLRAATITPGQLIGLFQKNNLLSGLKESQFVCVAPDLSHQRALG